MQIIRTQSARIVRQSPSQRVIIFQEKRVFLLLSASSLEQHEKLIQFFFYLKFTPVIIIINNNYCHGFVRYRLASNRIVVSIFHIYNRGIMLWI